MRLGASWKRLGGSRSRLGGVLVLEASWGRLGGVLERLGGVLKTSWRRFGAAADVAAAAAASDAACVGIPAALGRSWTAPGPLLGALGPIPRFLVL